MKRKLLKSLSAILIISLLVTAILGISIFYISTHLTTNEKTVDKGKNFRGSNRIEKLSIPSTFDDHDIPFDYIYADHRDSTDNKTMILVHGLGGNRHTVTHMAEYFAEMGYNVIAYDQRSHGENTAEYTTYGYFEREDLADLVRYIREKTNKTIGLWGWSYGGGTVGLSLDKKVVYDNVSFAIMESPVSSMKEIIRSKLKKGGDWVPASYLLFFSNVVNKSVLGFTYKEADLRKNIKDTDIPVLIINTEADQIVPYPMGTDVYEAIKGDKKEIMTVDDSKHTKIWKKHKKEYKEKIESFLNKYI